MAKKAKLDLSGDGIKKMAIEHCEKVVFGVCALILLLLAYWGYKKPVFDDSQNRPQTLITKAEDAQRKINSTTWSNDNNEALSFAKFRVADDKVLQKVEELNAIAMDPSKYPTFPPGEISLSVKPKRTNPSILGATDVQAKFAYQLIALNPGIGGGSSKINDAMYAPAPKNAPPKKKKKKKKKTTGGSYQSGMSGSGSTGGDEEGSPGAGGSGGSGGVPSSGGDGMGGGGASKQKNKMPDGPIHEPADSMLAELEGVPLDGMIAPDMDSDRNPTFPSVMWRQIVCVTAVVPYKKQVEAYEKALKGTRRYDPATDVPKYIGLVIHRRINGGEWKDVSDEISSFSKRAKTVMYPNLVANEQFDPFLNAQVPALLMNDFDEFVMHPKSTLRDFLALEEDEAETSSTESSSSKSNSFEDFGASGESSSGESGMMEEKEENYIEEFITSDNAAETKQVRFFDLLANSSIKPGDKLEYRVNVVLSNPNLPLSFITGEDSKKGTPTSGGSGSGDSMSSEDRRGGLMGAGGGGAGAPAGAGGSGAMPPASGGGRMGDGRDGGGGMGAGGGQVVDRSDELEIEMLGNPNISDADLDGAIRPAILKFKDMDPPEITDKGLAQKYGLISPDSNVSNAVQFVTPKESFVGGGAAPLTVRRANNVEFFDSEPQGELIYMKHDRSLQLPVPGRTKVFAGTPLKFEAMAKVFNPLDWSIRWVGPPAVDKDGLQDPKKRGDYQFDTEAIVLDVQPSVALDNISSLKREFLTPAEVLVFDGKGGFSLRNELDDTQAYRHAVFAADADSGSAADDIGGFGSGDRGGLTGSGGSSPDGSGGGFPGFGGN